MSQVSVRQARSGDEPAIHRVLVAAFESFKPLYTPGCYDATTLDPVRIAERMQEGPVFVAEHEGRIVGTVGVKRDSRGAYVRGMGVDPAVRRLGVGRRLLQACEVWARVQGAPCLWLSTTPFLEGSIALYQMFGFVPAPGPADLFGTPLRSFEKPLR